MVPQDFESPRFNYLQYILSSIAYTYYVYMCMYIIIYMYIIICICVWYGYIFNVCVWWPHQHGSNNRISYYYKLIFLSSLNQSAETLDPSQIPPEWCWETSGRFPSVIEKLVLLSARGTCHTSPLLQLPMVGPSASADAFCVIKFSVLRKMVSVPKVLMPGPLPSRGTAVKSAWITQ